MTMTRLPLAVVVVDDDPVIRTLLVRLFDADQRFTVVGTASDGHEAVEVVATHRPNLVLLDVSMPGGDGIAAAAEIRARSGDTHIAMCSSDRHRMDEAVQAGADLWVDKPIDFPALSSKLLAVATQGWSSPEQTDSWNERRTRP